VAWSGDDHSSHSVWELLEMIRCVRCFGFGVRVEPLYDEKNKRFGYVEELCEGCDGYGWVQDICPKGGKEWENTERSPS